MDIHKPKPVRGWREFINEIGIIVIGHREGLPVVHEACRPLPAARSGLT
jgi:hypothetical protein